MTLKTTTQYPAGDPRFVYQPSEEGAMPYRILLFYKYVAIEDPESFSAEHRDGAGAPVKVPNLFLIEIPIFAGSVRYRLAVRLRYRIAGGAVTWWIELARADEAFDDAFRHDAARAAEETGLPLLYGQPEAA